MRVFIFLFLALLATPAFANKPAESKKTPVIKERDLCTGREGCKLLWSQGAGKDDKGRTLVVSEVVVPFKSNDYTCNRPQDGHVNFFMNDVAQEIWLSTYGILLLTHQKLFGLCNNGYGNPATAEDKIDVEDNKLTHRGMGGGDQRWMGGHVFTLSPFTIQTRLNCGSHAVKGGGRFTALNYETGLFEESWSAPGSDNFIQCDALNVKEAGGKYKGFPIKQIYSFNGIKLNEIKKLGSCATRITSDEGPQQGFTSFGQNDGSKVMLALLRINDDQLWVDVDDKGRIFSASDRPEHDDRLEVWWVEEGNARQRRALRQFSIRLADLQVTGGYGYGPRTKLPEVERRDNKEGIRFLVSWPPSSFPSADGFAATYAHGNGNTTQYAFSTSTLRYGDATSLSRTINLQEEDKDTGLGCILDKDGVLDLAKPAITKIAK